MYGDIIARRAGAELTSMSYFGSNLKEKVVLDIANRVSVGHCVDLNCERVGRACC